MTYLDYNATSPTDLWVVESMIPVFTEQFRNPSSENHATGRTAKELVDQARKQIADSVAMRPADVTFTSGATEANNAVFYGSSGINNKPCVLAGHRAQISLGAT